VLIAAAALGMQDPDLRKMFTQPSPECGGVFDRAGRDVSCQHNDGGRRWPPRSRVSWALVHASSTLDEESTRRALRSVFAAWSAASGLQFTEVKEEKADVRVAFVRGNHEREWPGDGRAFDDNGREAAHSFYPPQGIVHFNDAIAWGPKEESRRHDFETFALHEIGHAIGLAHSSTGGSIMRSSPREGQHTLSDDDRAGVEALYGTLNGK